MTNFPLNGPGDDALDFLNAEGPDPGGDLFGSSDTGDTEDPVARGQSRAGAKDMFHTGRVQHIPKWRGGNAQPEAFLPNKTIGASRIP